MMRTFVTVLSCLALNFLLASCKSEETPPGPEPPTDFDIYVSDAGTPNSPAKILKYDGEGNNGTTFISGNLTWPQDIVFLEDQAVVLVSDLTSGNILRCNAGTGAFIDMFATGIGGPTRMKVKDNLLYVLQWGGNGKVLRYKMDGTFFDEFTETGVSQSIGLDWDSSGNLYVSSYSRGSGGFVQKFDPAGKDLGRFIAGGLSGPTNIWFDDEANLLLIDWQVGHVKKFTPEGKLIKILFASLSQPEGVAELSDGFFLIGNGGTASVKMYDKDYNLLKDLVAPRAAGLVRPNAVVIRKK